ncbi:twin-arginine translocase subunit TatC [Alkaliphilus peptidifermentans]|uniref:Sec-independent protein translocase protein TatC n=1 Tax=Alkaliphilus peptidifermentans DSM 18978 TaxID=1120976 RepID=A0A1G5EX01_9FIRM|nr:twin-arginine translocase subunit TatC [Alkaliphilus peptidifermentans]SCY31509.1 Sec-independent protein translocase TatC [Alkaliphilus peptidifermentans DSM 18978]
MTEKRLTLVGHLEELRKRIIIVAFFIMAGTIFSYYNIDLIVDLILKPAVDLHFIYLSPADLFLAYIKIALVSGIVIALPIVLYNVWQFVMPGMGIKHKIYIVLANIASMVFFFVGAVFAYLIIIPLTIEFFTKMSRQEIEPLFSFANYTSFISSIILSFGLTFQLPILILLLTQFNLITPTLLKKSRRVLIVVIFIVAAILTPPDVISQVLLAAPMILLLELSIIISSIVYKRKKIIK